MANKTNGYKIDFSNNTVTINYTFAAAAAKIGSSEYNTLKAVKKDFPQMTIITKSGREKKKPRKNKGLTYKHMEAFILAKGNLEMVDRFYTVRRESLASKSPYKYVCDWFKTQFPNYDKATASDSKIIKLNPLQSEEKEREKQVAGF